MKTHKARWQQNSPTTWILKEPASAGSAALATITDRGEYVRWELTGGAIHIAESRYAAQRACRRALREGTHDN